MRCSEVRPGKPVREIGVAKVYTEMSPTSNRGLTSRPPAKTICYNNYLHEKP
jgi:hypothetical protein